jgi:hypothetical protein
MRAASDDLSCDTSKSSSAQGKISNNADKGAEFRVAGSPPKPPKPAYDIYSNPNHKTSHDRLSQSKARTSKRAKVTKFLKEKSSKFRSGSPTAYGKHTVEDADV